MPKITLRDYLEGIEEFIEDGKIDEAITHCRYILKIYPKNVATYRLLGKAHLEEKRFGDAGDIFQRVLSSAPDDFVSHVGMSIIREDEGNLDAGISHMERAFESQPSNRAVQDELRRLYGQREGFTLPKVRLTRAALARMYSHGDLYNQAIGELRSAIREDGARPELLILLAEMYAKTEQYDQALKTSAEILEKLPYCLYANHLSAEIISKENDDQKASEYLKKVEELDPYQIHTAAGEDPKHVGAEEVVLEHLILHTDALESQDIPRAWTGALEPLLEDDAKDMSEDLPDWLSVPPEEEAQEEIEAPLGTSELKALKELAPDAPKDDEDIPTWMQELRPEENLESEDIAETSTASTSPFESSEAGNVEETDSFRTNEENANSHAELENAKDNDIANVDEDDGLAWLEGLAANQGAKEEELLSDPETREEVDPDWVGKDEDKVSVEKRSLTWWLDELEKSEDIEATAINPEEIENIEDDKDTSLPEQADNEKETIQFSPAPGALAELNESESNAESISDDTPDWLKELADELEGGTQSKARTSREALENPPEWMEEFRTSGKESNEDSIVEDTSIESLSEEKKVDDEPEKNSLDFLDDWVEPEDEASTVEAKEPKKGNLDDLAEISNLDSETSNDWVPEKGIREDQNPTAELPDFQEIVEEQDEGKESEPEIDQVSPLANVPVKDEKSSDPLNEILEQARQALNFDKFDEAVRNYGKVLRSRKYVDEVIADLQAALTRHPRHVALWQTLGDAFMRGDRLRKALDSYTKAEDLL